MITWKLTVSQLIFFVFGIIIGQLIIHQPISYKLNHVLLTTTEKRLTENVLQVSSNVIMINLDEPVVNASFECIKTKKILNYISTTICLYQYEKDTYVSNTYRNKDTIWEEGLITRMLKVLIRHPHLDFIDIGANIGSYAMFAAALGRFVLAVDCFGPNIDRIHRAVQLSNVNNRVVLIQNAIFSRSGELLQLSADNTNIGAQRLDVSKKHNQSVINNPYIVKTIRFDDLAPIFISRGIRGAIMKMDIEGSESYVLESGSRIFELLDIPFVQMEWSKVPNHSERLKVILDFFARHNYDPMTFSCQLLHLNATQHWPYDVIWIKRNVTGFCDVPDSSSIQQGRSQGVP